MHVLQKNITEVQVVLFFVNSMCKSFQLSVITWNGLNTLKLLDNV